MPLDPEFLNEVMKRVEPPAVPKRREVTGNYRTPRFSPKILAKIDAEKNQRDLDAERSDS